MLEKIGLPPKPSLRGNNWVVDASNCQGCASQFTFINRKHHCRRCGGLFCNSCTQQRMLLRGQGDSPVRICEPCKKLEEAARFEMRHGHKNRAGRGASKLTSKNEDEVLSKILGNGRNDPASSGQESNESLPSMQRASSSASCSNIQVTSQKEGGERFRSFSVDAHSNVSNDMGFATPEELRQQAVDEKKKYKILKAEGKPEEALRAFKRGKELERQAGALEIEIRRNRKRAMSSLTTNETQKLEDDIEDSGRRTKPSSQTGKNKDDLASELRELGWSDLDLRDADRKPASMSLEGELSTLVGEISQKNNYEKGTHGIDKSEVIALKKRALALKREGKLAEAKEELKRAKILEKQIEEQELLGDTEDSDDELSSLIRSMDIDKQDLMSTGNGGNVKLNFDNFLGMDDNLGVESNFDATDEDMDDPEITAALNSLGWAEDTNDPDEIEASVVHVDREKLLREIQSLKREALNEKRAGKTAEALTLLKKAKALEADIDSFEPQENDQSAQKSRQQGPVTQPAENSSKSDVDHKLTPKSRLAIQRELLAVKKKALAMRREGKLDEADEELKKGKALEQQLEEMDNSSKLKVTQQVNVSNNHVVVSAATDVGYEEEDVTDQDMHDPSYISLLQNLGWKDEDDDHARAPPQENVSISPTTADVSLAQVHSSTQIEASRKSKGEIQRELLGLKRKSLALRRQGEVDEAEEVLKMAKVLEAQLAEMEAPKQEVIVEFEKLKMDAVIDSSLKNPGKEIVVGVLLDEKTPMKGSITNDESRYEEREQLDRVIEKGRIDDSNSLQQEILVHKREAVRLKREGKLAEAKEELRQAKLLEKKNMEDKSQEPSTSSSNITSSDAIVTPIVKKEQKTSPGPRLSPRDRFKLQQESLGHKRQALKLRREGRMEEAEAEFELAKALEAQLEELSAHDSTKPSEPVDDIGIEDLLDTQLLSALREIGLDSPSNVSHPTPQRAEPVKQVADTIEDPNKERMQLEERIKSEKVKAVNLKRSGKQAEALDALRRAKFLEKKLNS